MQQVYGGIQLTSRWESPSRIGARLAVQIANLSFTHHSNEVAYKNIADSNETNGLTKTNGDWAITWVCYTNGSCSDNLGQGEPIPYGVDHANTFVQTDTSALAWVGKLDGSCAIRMYEHEAGHAQGSAHATSSGDVMYPTFGPTNCTDQFTSNDVGLDPPCTGQPQYQDSGNTAGLACVYEWTYP